MKIHSLFGLLILGLQFGFLNHLKAMDPPSLPKGVVDCANALEFSSTLEQFLYHRQQVFQNPTEENYQSFKKSYQDLDAEVTTKTRRQITPLHGAALDKNIEVISELVEKQGIEVDIRGPVGATPFMVLFSQPPMVSRFYLDPMNRLLTLGADINASDLLGLTALHRVFFIPDQLSFHTLHFLLDHDVDIHVPNLLGLTPIIGAILTGNDEAFHLLRSRGASLNIHAVDAPNALIANYMYHSIRRPSVIEKDVNLDLSEDMKDMRADSRREARTTMARLILDEDPSLLHTADRIYKATSLHWASFYGDTEGVALFLERGLSPTVVNGDGEVPLHVAARADEPEAFWILYQADPSLITATDNKGRTPEITAREHNATRVLKVIKDKGIHQPSQPSFFTSLLNRFFNR